ncbi:hypothetical protein TNCV_1959381 [Trichonephila clavipes]|nr:hypothetical protein TNCV_1959381 [Trichonephila clavipes]
MGLRIRTIADLVHSPGAGISFCGAHHIGEYQLPQYNFDGQLPPQREAPELLRCDIELRISFCQEYPNQTGTLEIFNTPHYQIP